MDPLMVLLLIDKIFNFVKLPMVDGMVLENMFSSNTSVWRSCKRSMVFGKEPLKKFFVTLTICNFGLTTLKEEEEEEEVGSSPNQGRVPDRLFSVNINIVRLEIDVRLFGKVPFKKGLRWKESIWSDESE